MRSKLLNILTICCLLALCGCGREEEFADEFADDICTIEGFTPADAQNVADALNSF